MGVVNGVSGIKRLSMGALGCYGPYNNLGFADASVLSTGTIGHSSATRGIIVVEI
jgi:hypothetical protein